MENNFEKTEQPPNYVKNICEWGCDPCACLAPLLHGVITGEIKVQRDTIKDAWGIEVDNHCRDLHIHCTIHNKKIHLCDNNAGYYYHVSPDAEINGEFLEDESDA